MIYLIFVQYIYVKHRLQIPPERWKYDLTTNSVKFTQQTTSSAGKERRKLISCLAEVSSGSRHVVSRQSGHCQEVTIMFVTNTYCSAPTQWIVWMLKQVLQTSISDTNTSSQLASTHRCELHQWLSAAAHVTWLTSIIHCSTSLTSRILFWALLHCLPDFIVIGFRLELSRQPHVFQDEFCKGLTCKLQRAIEIGFVVIIQFHKVVQNHS